jgi:hypothetical protein
MFDKDTPSVGGHAGLLMLVNLPKSLPQCNSGNCQHIGGSCILWNWYQYSTKLWDLAELVDKEYKIRPNTIRSLILTYLSYKGWHYLDDVKYCYDINRKYFYFHFGEQQYLPETKDKRDKDFDGLDFGKNNSFEYFRTETEQEMIDQIRKENKFEYYTENNYERMAQGWYRFPLIGV